MRRVPIFKPSSKMDRAGREAPELNRTRFESELGLTCWPVNWPIVAANRFRV